MTALDPKETARYTARLFGYFLAVAIVGGGITAGGVALLRNENVFSGSVDASAEVIVGGALAGVGILLLLAGFLAIVLNVVADGVRFGVEGTTRSSEAEPGGAPAPAWTPGQQPRAAARTPPPRRRPAAGEPERRRRPEGSEATAEDDGDDQTWKREVEEKLADEDRPERTGATDGTDTDREARRESGVERDPGSERPTEPADTGTGTPARESTVSGGTDRSNSEAWVSGDEVSGEEPTETEGTPPETGAEDDPLAPGSADEPEPTDATDDESDSPAWLEGSGSDEDEDDR